LYISSKACLFLSPSKQSFYIIPPLQHYSVMRVSIGNQQIEHTMTDIDITHFMFSYFLILIVFNL